jgi:UDP-2,3-diacylglucosamine pyrophosphatase LpxH
VKLHCATHPESLELPRVNSFAVISDVHLRNPADERTGQFLAMLASLPDIDHLFLLGDIFDFVFVQSRYYTKRWEALFQRLETVASRGVTIVFVEGNHDFGFSLPLDPELSRCFSHAGDLIVNFRHPALGRVMLRHGDDIVCTESYLNFRALVKSLTFQRCAALIPGVIMEQLFSRWARFSRSRDDYRKLTPAFFTDSIQGRVMTQTPPPDTLIIGHVHEYIDTRVGSIRCLSGPDWFSAPSLLHCTPSGNIVRTFASGKVLPLFQLAGLS